MKNLFLTLAAAGSVTVATAQFSIPNYQSKLAFNQVPESAPIIQVDQRFKPLDTDEQRKYERKIVAGNLLMIGGLTTVGIGLIVPPMKVLSDLDIDELGPMAKKMVVSSVIGGIAYGVGAVMVKNAKAHSVQLTSTSSGIGLELTIPYQKQKSVNTFSPTGK